LLLRNAALRGHLSSRGLDRITRVARTIERRGLAAQLG
jgi:hypothetical protein